MLKADVIAVLGEVADLLEITEANAFEVMAYRNAARALEDWHGDLDEAVAQETLRTIPTIGKGLSRLITDLVRSGTSDELARVRGLVPPELPALLKVRGLGPKRVRALWRQLGIESAVDLRKAADEGRVAALAGFGAKTVERIVSGLDYLESEAPRAARESSAAVALPQAAPAAGRIWAGMSGYSYPLWKGSFYPPETRAADFLSHYARRLPTVEINNTFYHFPSQRAIDEWRGKTPASFRFSMKVHRRITHYARLGDAARDQVVEFVERSAGLGERLACILFQLPPDFARDDARLEAWLGWLPAGPRYAIEFRHPSWFVDEVESKLRARNVASVAVDAEDRPRRRPVTADFVYARLRRAAYAPGDLADWDAWFTSQRAENRDVLAYLKHDQAGTAPDLLLAHWIGRQPSAARDSLHQALSRPKPRRATAPRRRKSG